MGGGPGPDFHFTLGCHSATGIITPDTIMAVVDGKGSIQGQWLEITAAALNIECRGYLNGKQQVLPKEKRE
jgi:hypothetical protein